MWPGFVRDITQGKTQHTSHSNPSILLNLFGYLDDFNLSRWEHFCNLDGTEGTKVQQYTDQRQ